LLPRVDYLLIETEPYRMKAFGWSGKELRDFLKSHGFVAAGRKIGHELTPVSPDYIPGDITADCLYVNERCKN
jgi:hypothetical protein